MEIHIAGEEIAYDGSQLASHFALRRFGVRGDSMVVFQGPMDIRREKIADLEDLLDDRSIRSGGMLHFIVECFGSDLEALILRQRLLARLAADLISAESGRPIRVDGDDLYFEDRKLSVSIAAPSPVSVMVHFGVNLVTRDVPVPAACLEELGVAAGPFALKLCEAFRDELESIRWARSKVRAVP